MAKATKEMMEQAQYITAKCEELLHGQGPDIQGMVLVDLVATWLAGHQPEARPAVLQVWKETVQKLIPVVEQEVLRRYGCKDWDEVERRFGTPSQ